MTLSLLPSGLLTRPTRRTVAIALLLALAATGCTSVKLDKKGGGDAATETPGTLPPPDGVSSVAVVSPEVTSDPLNDPASPLAKRIIYFDLDSYVVQPEFQSVVEEHARYLSTHRQRRILIEGHTDERGGREYNLALGQKRADAVRRALAALGVNEDQMEAISFGEEKPRSTGADDAAWAENRRVELDYSSTGK